MFVTEFKRMLQHFPDREAGFDAFMQRIEQDRAIRDTTSEFFSRVTNYALNRATAVDSAPLLYDSRLLLTALAISRFPIEILGSPEEPVRFTLLNKAVEFLGAIDVVLYVLNPAEDDASDDFLDSETCAEYLLALNEFHRAWILLID